MILGSVDGLDRHLICGWAYDVSRPDQAVTISVFLDGALLFETKADNWRRDLAEETVGNGRHAFVHCFPQAIDDDRLSNISVTAEGQRLPIERARLKNPSAPFTTGIIERLDRDGVAGWAYNTAAPEHPVTVSILLDNRLLGTLEANLHRPDLEDANIGGGYHAFSYPFQDRILDEELAGVSVRVNSVELPYATTLQPFHGSLVTHSPGIGRIWLRALVFPI